MNCTACNVEVKPFEAYRRSVNLRPVAWCRPCWKAREAQPTPVIPAQRRRVVRLAIVR